MNSLLHLSNRLSYTLLTVVVLCSMMSCSSKYADKIDRGEGFKYQAGFPEIRTAVTGQLTEINDAIIIVSTDIVYESLIFVKEGDSLQASVLINISLRQKDGDYNNNLEFEETIRSADNQITFSQEVHRFQRVFNVDPGEYEVEVVVFDKETRKQTISTQETRIPNPDENVSHITEIRVLGKNSNTTGPENTFLQATTYDISSSFDSLMFVFQVTNNIPENPLELKSRLIRFRADTSVARPMTYNNMSPSSIIYKGIDYDNYEVIQTSTRTLSQPGSVLIEYMYTDLPRGNYRLEVRANEGTKNEIYKARDFGIKSTYYPSLRTTEELAQPLVYLMSDAEFEDLMAIEDEEELKAAIDRFWLSNIQNSNLARNVLSQYYQRVEEANKLFSNFKEGWKTDRGMIYVLFGMPYYETKSLRDINWAYSYNLSAPEYNFVFRRNKSNSDYYPFDHYVLQRSNAYFQIEYRVRELWLSGRILTTTL